MSPCRRRHQLALLPVPSACSGRNVRSGGGPIYVVCRSKLRPGGQAGFTLMDPARTGLNFTNTLSDENAAQNQIRLNGSGVALGDVDGTVGVTFSSVRSKACGALSEPGRLAIYQHHRAAGLDQPGNFSTGATFADVDGNGTLDLLINGIGTGTRLFLNDGHGHFTEAKDSGLRYEYGAMTCALADIDGDGRADLYVETTVATVRSTGSPCLNGGGQRMMAGSRHLEITADGRSWSRARPHCALS